MLCKVVFTTASVYTLYDIWNQEFFRVFFFIIAWRKSDLSSPIVCMKGCVKKRTQPRGEIQGTNNQKSMTFCGSHTNCDMLSGGTND